MKKTLCLVLVLMLACVVLLSACDNGGTQIPIQNNGGDSTTETPSNNGENAVGDLKQIPIYQGMTITDSNSATLSLTSMNYRSSGIMLLSSNNGNNGNNSNNGDNGNHYGHYKGDCTDDEDVVDTNNPYPDNEEQVEDEIKDSLDVIGSTKGIYYAAPNQDIYINIHISNPDKYEILSFTLNGEKYSSYMFEQGSTLETLILKVNVGNASGIVEYTIDQIKYVDGTEIKDVKIDGEKTVKAGIKTENQVSSIISNVNVGTNSISFDAKITDKDSLIAYSNGAIKAVLYDGEELVATKDIVVGENSIVFDSLKTNSVYQYAIVAFYDDLSGNGVEAHILSKEAFSTNAVVLFDNIAVGKENTTFEFKWDESVANKALTSLKLYQGETLLRELAVNATSIDGLLSGADYTLIAEYQNLGKTENIKLEFTTLMKEAYVVSITNPTQTQTSVGFEISETDTDNVGSVTKIELYKGDQLVKEADSLDVRSFDGLLSNNTYTVKITYTYNLNDGAGDQTAEKTLDIKTDAKATPVVSLTIDKADSLGIKFSIEDTDVDNICEITQIVLLDSNGTVIASGDANVRTFDSVELNKSYVVKIIYTCDFNDGNGLVTKEVSKNIDILPKQNVSYTVKYYLQNIEDNNYTLSETQNLTGTEASEVTGVVKQFTGFTAPTAQTKIITIDGKMVIEYYYTRNSYTVTFVSNGGNEVSSASYKYGQSLPVPTRENYTFGGWSETVDLKETAFVMGDKEVTYYAWWAEETKPSYFKYAGSTRITITGNNGNLPSEIWIPSYIGGKPVYKISGDSFDNSNVKKAVIGEGISVVEAYAFNFCKNLMSVTIPSSVTTLGDSHSSTFNGCIHLMEIYNLSNAYDMRFKIVPGLYTNLNEESKITKDENGFYFFEDSEESYLFAYEGGKSEITLPSASPTGKQYKIYDDAFSWGCVRLTKVIISEGVTEIGEYAFMGCGVKEVYISKTVVKIGQGAFARNYYSLEDVTFENPLNWVSVDHDRGMNEGDLVETPLDLSDSYDNALLFRSDESGRYWYCK